MSQPTPGRSDVPSCVHGTVTTRLVRDILARIERALEAVADGDYLFAEGILDDLAAELWRLLERAETT